MNKDLLQERYLVIADFPHTDFKIGELIDGTPFENNWGVDFKDYPAIFRKLSWWEFREEKDMPEYVSYVSLTLKDKFGDDESKTRKYVKIKSWYKTNERWGWYYNYNKFSTLCNSHLPATEEEYLSYQKSKSNL